jgi:hypothetical protein
MKIKMLHPAIQSEIRKFLMLKGLLYINIQVCLACVLTSIQCMLHNPQNRLSFTFLLLFALMVYYSLYY